MGPFGDNIEINKTQRIDGELRAAGVIFDGIDGAGNISGLRAGQESLAALVLAAKEKPLSSPECLAVRDALGAASAEWAAYQAVRQVFVQHKRLEQFQTAVLKLIVELFYTATYQAATGGQIAVFKTAKLTEAKNKIDAIIAQFPDEV